MDGDYHSMHLSRQPWDCLHHDGSCAVEWPGSFEKSWYQEALSNYDMAFLAAKGAGGQICDCELHVLKAVRTASGIQTHGTGLGTELGAGHQILARLKPAFLRKGTVQSFGNEWGTSALLDHRWHLWYTIDAVPLSFLPFQSCPRVTLTLDFWAAHRNMAGNPRPVHPRRHAGNGCVLYLEGRSNHWSSQLYCKVTHYDCGRSGEHGIVGAVSRTTMSSLHPVLKIGYSWFFFLTFFFFFPFWVFWELWNSPFHSKSYN